MTLAGHSEPNRPTRRVIATLLAILIPVITVIGALVLAMLELNS